MRLADLSRSFGKEKRSFVVRNLAIIEGRFPEHRAECAAFGALDPLRPLRQAIERSATPQNRRPRLLVTGAGTDVVREWAARQMSSDGDPAFVLTVQRRPSGPIVELADGSAAAPQSLSFDLAAPDECDALFSYLKALRPSRIEIADPVTIPKPLAERLPELNTPCDILMPDAGLHGNDAPQLPQGRGRIYARKAAVLARKGRRRQNGASHRLGLIPVKSSTQEDQLMRDIVLAFTRFRPDASIVVIGGTLDDLDLVHIGNTFGTGQVDPNEIEHQCRVYRLSSLFLCGARPLAASSDPETAITPAGSDGRCGFGSRNVPGIPSERADQRAIRRLGIQGRNRFRRRHRSRCHLQQQFSPCGHHTSLGSAYMRLFDPIELPDQFGANRLDDGVERDEVLSRYYAGIRKNRGPVIRIAILGPGKPTPP